MKQLTLLLCLSLFLGTNTTTLRGSDCHPQDKAPNILILLADDMGYGELGCYGQEEIKTPNIDALAEQGLRFTDFYAGTAVCSPSRAVLFTGVHAGHATIRGNKGFYPVNDTWDRVALTKSEITIAEMLKNAGYQTAFYDIMPTLADVAGITTPEQTDGISFLPEVLGQEQVKHEHLYWELQVVGREEKAEQFRKAARMGNWKAVRYGVNGTTELYNLENDVKETRNVADQYPEIVERMEKILSEESKESLHFPYSG